jgi:preprotein translocase subunit YajC
MFHAFLMLPAEAEPQVSPLGGLSPILMMGLVFVALWLIVLRPAQKREKAQRQAMLASLKKNDKVLTSAGIIGIVALVNDKEDEVTLKVDESSNVRLRVLKSTIVRNYTSEEAAKEQAAKEKAGKGKDEAVASA